MDDFNIEISDKNEEPKDEIKKVESKDEIKKEEPKEEIRKEDLKVEIRKEKPKDEIKNNQARQGKEEEKSISNSFIQLIKDIDTIKKNFGEKYIIDQIKNKVKDIYSEYLVEKDEYEKIKCKGIDNFPFDALNNKIISTVIIML